MEFLDQRQVPTLFLFRFFSSTFHDHYTMEDFYVFFVLSYVIVISRKPLSFSILFSTNFNPSSTLYSFAAGYSEIQGETVTDSEIIRGRDRICRSREIYGTTVLARA